MDYRITFVYADASTRRKYCSTEQEVSNYIVQEMRSSVAKPILTVHIAYL